MIIDVEQLEKVHAEAEANELEILYEGSIYFVHYKNTIGAGEIWPDEHTKDLWVYHEEKPVPHEIRKIIDRFIEVINGSAERIVN